jgi:stress-induced morphogen
LTIAEDCSYRGRWRLGARDAALAIFDRKPMPNAEELKGRIEQALPGSEVAVEDLTGGGDHFRAEIVSDRFDGLTRIEQHKLVYDIFEGEIGGAIHALSMKTSTPGGI